MASETSGQSAWATGCKSFRPKSKCAAAKPKIVALSESRFKLGEEKIAFVSKPAAGFTTTKRACGICCAFSSGVIVSPIPSTHALLPLKKNGTSAPMLRPMVSSAERGSSRFHSLLRASKVVAASDEPPPMPACAGCFSIHQCVRPACTRWLAATRGRLSVKDPGPAEWWRPDLRA